MALTNLSRRGLIELPEGAYDVRGWNVHTQVDGERVGSVDDMLIDEHDTPRYLDVDLGVFRKHILVPLSEAHADPSERVVWIEGLDRDRLREVPEYDHDLDSVSPAFEERLLREYRTLAGGERGASDGETRTASGGRLVRLGDLEEFRVASGASDPRGWDLVGGDGQVLGEVKELIVDATALTTRYLACRVDEDKVGLESLDRHILVPADRARLNKDDKEVLVDQIFARDLREYPIYQGLPLDSEAKARIHAVFERGSGPRTQESGSRRFFGARPRAEATEPPRAKPRGRPALAPDRVEERNPEASDQQSRVVEVEGGEEVRIRISGGDIIIEKQRGRQDDG